MAHPILLIEKQVGISRFVKRNAVQFTFVSNTAIV
jgi:hypothetical protein